MLRTVLKIAEKTVYHPMFLGAATAALLVLSFPKFNSGFLAWIALAPFALAVLRFKNSRQAIDFGLYTGFLCYGGMSYWICISLYAARQSAGIAAASWLLLAGFLAIEWMLLGWCAYHLSKAGKFFPLAAAAAWTFIEWFKITLSPYIIWLPGFLLGYTQWRYPEMIQVVSITGTYGLSFIIAYSGFSLGYALYAKTSLINKSKILLMPSVLLAAAMVFGIYRVKTYSFPSSAQTLRVSILQPNIDQYKKWDRKFVLWIEQRLDSQLAEAAKKKPQLVIWPEAALPGWIEEDKYKLWVSSCARSMQAYHLVGTLSRRERDYVSAFMFNPEGVISGIYDKRILVPFGEYVPLNPILRNYANVLDIPDSCAAGKRGQPLIGVGNIKLGTSICYEAIFPYLWRENAENGANVFVNITNDGWFLDTAGPYQHFLSNIFRAVENGLPVIRAANTGISGWIDPLGRIQESSKVNTDTVMTFNVPVIPFSNRSFYAKHGDIFAAACLAVFLAFMLAVLIFA